MLAAQRARFWGTSSESLEVYRFEPPAKTTRKVFKILLILMILALSGVSLPTTEAIEADLTNRNLLELINRDRVKAGLQPLTPSIKLEQAAQAKARDILEKNYFAHVSPEGLEPWDFIREADFQYVFAGENLAINYLNAYELHQDFLNSSSHRENLLSSAFSEVGIAVMPGVKNGQPSVVTVQMFATPLTAD